MVCTRIKVCTNVCMCVCALKRTAQMEMSSGFLASIIERTLDSTLEMLFGFTARITTLAGVVFVVFESNAIIVRIYMYHFHTHHTPHTFLHNSLVTVRKLQVALEFVGLWCLEFLSHLDKTRWMRVRGNDAPRVARC